MKIHYKISVDPLRESTSVTAECGFIVPNVYFPVVYVPGSVPVEASAITNCKECWEKISAKLGPGKFLIYGLVERREVKQEESVA